MELGDIFYFKRPTKKVIEKHGLEVSREEIPHYTCINKYDYLDLYFGSTVLYLGKDFLDGDQPKKLKCIDVVIIDKEKVRIKENIRNILGTSIKVPLCLLTPAGKVIDIRNIPMCINAFTCLFSGDKTISSGELIKRETVPSIPELVARLRKTVLTYEKPGTDRALIDYSILNSSNMYGTIYYTLGRMVRYSRGCLICFCGEVYFKQEIIGGLIDHTRYKKPRNKFTFNCLCGRRYKLVLGQDKVDFVGIGKTKEKLMTREEYNRLTAPRWPPVITRTTRVRDVILRGA